jgi:hypothetical protein
MILFYHNKPKSSLPYNTNAIKIESIESIKPHLKSILEENEGQEYVDVAVYDGEFFDSSLMEYFKKYLNLSVFRVTIIDPMKVYELPNSLDVNILISFSKPNAMQRVKKIKNDTPYVRTHLIDDYRYSVINVQRQDFDTKNK